MIKKKAASALLSVFPNLSSFYDFSRSDENKEAVWSLVNFSYETGLISEKKQASLELFLRENEKSLIDMTATGLAGFKDFLDRREVLMDTRLSARAMTHRANALLDKYHILLPSLSNSMLTRLKREPADTLHKKNVLRSLAFWLGYEKPDPAISLNYEVLFQSCGVSRQAVRHKEGVRIGFVLHSRGDVIDHEIVSWLKREIKDYVQSAIFQYQYGSWGRVRSLDITTLYVDFPKEKTISNPIAFRQSVRSAVSLAHQLAIRWALSKYATSKRSFTIGIVSGGFNDMDKYLVPILNAKLPDDPVIRMTDFTRQCLLINDIRSQICPDPISISLFDGESLNISWLQGFGSFIYHDFIPKLMEDQILTDKTESNENLTRSLWIPNENSKSNQSDDQPDAVTIYMRTPQNTMLGLEIARMLYFRSRFWEAIEILKVVLSIFPADLNARSLRMVIFRDLAVKASSYSLAEKLIRQANEEADYIVENCSGLTEDFYCEYAVVFLTHAILTLGAARTGLLVDGIQPGADHVFYKIVSLLDQAESILYKGLFLSPSGARSIYLLISVKLVSAILQHEPSLLNNTKKPVDGPPEVIRSVISELYRQTGYMRDDLPPEQQIKYLENAYRSDYLTYGDLVSLKTYRPTSDYCGAVSWWDYMPGRTVGAARRVIRILKHSREMAELMRQKDLSIYSFCRVYGEMVPAADFIDQVEKAIGKVRDTVGEDLSGLDDREKLPLQRGRSDLILTLQI